MSPARTDSGSVTGPLNLDWAAAAGPLQDAPESGDAYLIREEPDGVLVAAIDGLGHGPAAERAALAARRCLEEGTPGQPLPTLMQACHGALSGTRGAALTLVRFTIERLEWVAVGNVSALLRRPEGTRHVPLRGGIVGAHIPTLRGLDSHDLIADDLVVLATDGIRSAFSSAVPFYGAVETIVGTVLDEFSRGTDDALVVAVRYRGPAAGPVGGTATAGWR